MQIQTIKAVEFLKSTDPKGDIKWSIEQAAKDVKPADLDYLAPMLAEVEKIGRPDCALTASQVFELLSFLGIELDRLLPLRALSDQEKEMIIAMIGTDDGNLEPGEGLGTVGPDQIGEALAPQIRFYAVLELFPVPLQEFTNCLICHMP